MPWFAPRTWASLDLFTAEDADKYVRDNGQYNLDTIRQTQVAAQGDGWSMSALDTVTDIGTTPPVCSLTKRQDDTLIRVQFSLTLYSDSEPTLLSLSLNTHLADALPLYLGVAGMHFQFTGWLDAGVTIADDYDFNLRVEMAYGGPVHWDDTDYICLEAREVTSN